MLYAIAMGQIIKDCCVAYCQEGDYCVLDMLDRACPVIIEQVLPHLPGSEKVTYIHVYFSVVEVSMQCYIVSVNNTHIHSVSPCF